MEVLYTNCAGLDVHKKTVKVCVLTQASNGQLHKEFRTYFTTTEELLKLGDWLIEQGCTHVAFEATGVFTPVASKAIWAHPCSFNQSQSFNNSSVVVK